MGKRFVVVCVGTIVLGAAVYWVARTVSGPSDTVRWVRVPDLKSQLMVSESVFWEPLDTESLRKMLREYPEIVKGKSVLEIGTGSGPHRALLRSGRSGTRRRHGHQSERDRLRATECKTTRLSQY